MPSLSVDLHKLGVNPWRKESFHSFISLNGRSLKLNIYRFPAPKLGDI